jgi:hypothetical protein
MEMDSTGGCADGSRAPRPVEGAAGSKGLEGGEITFTPTNPLPPPSTFVYEFYNGATHLFDLSQTCTPSGGGGPSCPPLSFAYKFKQVGTHILQVYVLNNCPATGGGTPADTCGNTYGPVEILIVTVTAPLMLVGTGVVPQVSTVSAGYAPWGLYVDPSTNIAYVVNAGSAGPDNTIAEVNLETGATIRTISTDLAGPRGVWFDDATGNVWVAGGGSDVVEAFNGVTGALVANVAVGAEPYSLVHDPIDNSLWVTDFESSQISEISLSSNEVMATISTGSGSFPYFITMDPSTGLVFATNSEAGSNDVFVLNATTQSIVGIVNIPTTSYSQDAVYVSDGEVFVTGTNSNSVSEFSEADFTNVSTISGPAGAWGLAYDPELDLLAVGGLGDGATSFYCASTFAAIPAPSSSVSTASPYSLAFDPSLNLLAVESVPSYGSGNLEIFNVTQLAGYCPASLEQGAPVASASAIDMGQSVTFSVSVTGGTGVYTYDWLGLPTGCAPANSSTITCTPSTIIAMDPEISVQVTDTAGVSVNSSATSLAIDPSLTITAPTPSAESFGVGQTFSISATPSGGSGDYTAFAWSDSSSGLGCTLSDSLAIECDPSGVGTYSVQVNVTDSNGDTVHSPALSLLVMDWNAGNLCSVQKGNCQFTGSGHCAPALAYSFNASFQTLKAEITGSSDCVYLNISGSHDVLDLTVTGSSLPYLQVILAGWHDFVNLDVTGSSNSAFVYLFGAYDTYNLTASGSSLTAKTYFLGFTPGNDSAPDQNLSSTDTYHLSIVGSNDNQYLTWVNSVGWSSEANTVKAPRNIATGSSDYLTYQNLTGVWAGPWDSSSGLPSFIPSTPTGAIPPGDPV